MITIPPHCSHKVQPLDCTVFGPFKRYYNVAVKSWMLDNPGKAMTICNIRKFLNPDQIEKLKQPHDHKGHNTVWSSKKISAASQFAQLLVVMVTITCDRRSSTIT